MQQTHLDREMAHLKESLLRLTFLVEENVILATDSFREMDTEGAKRAIDKDEEIDQMEIKVEEECLKMLALYQPVARNLRTIVTILKINNDLERIGDLAVNIAKCSLFLNQQPKMDTHFHFSTMIDKTRCMLKKSLECMIHFDAPLAYDVMHMDDEVDAIKKEQETMITDYTTNHPQYAGGMIRFLSVSRYLERIADHATNIAEDIIYSVNGDIIRHHFSKS